MNILIVEDEPRTARLLKEMIEEIDTSYFVLSICESIRDTVKFLGLQQKILDLIFMDIQLADGVSFEIFKQVEVTTPVVFCTAYHDYSLEAFKNNGIDYILKPFKEEDLTAVFHKIARLRTALALSDQVLKLQADPQINTSILIKYKDKIYPLEIADIGAFFLEDEVIYAYDFHANRHPIFRSLSEVYDMLDPKLFYRINRQVIVNRKAVNEIEPYFHRKMIVKLTFHTRENIILSKTKITDFMGWLENR